MKIWKKSFFSMISVAWGALFAELTTTPALRVSAMKYSQIGILLSINIIPLSEVFSDSLRVCFLVPLFCKIVIHIFTGNRSYSLASYLYTTDTNQRHCNHMLVGQINIFRVPGRESCNGQNKITTNQRIKII